MTLWRTLFGFEGRIGRATLWLSGVAVLLIDLSVMVLVSGWVHSTFQIDGVPHRPDGSVVGAGLGLVVVATVSVWSGLALKVKRCHDLGRSGWWLLAALVPVVGALWLLVELGFRPGDRRRNRFGEALGAVGGEHAAEAVAEPPLDEDALAAAPLAPFPAEADEPQPETQPEPDHDRALGAEASDPLAELSQAHEPVHVSEPVAATEPQASAEATEHPAEGPWPHPVDGETPAAEVQADEAVAPVESDHHPDAPRAPMPAHEPEPNPKPDPEPAPLAH